MSIAKLKPPAGPARMSVRECRLIVERLLVVAGLEPGRIPATRDLLVEAALLGVDVLGLLRDDPALFQQAGHGRYRIVDREDGVVELHADSELGAVIAPIARDLVVERCAQDGGCTVHVIGARHVELLVGTVSEIGRRGIAVALQAGAATAVGAPSGDARVHQTPASAAPDAVAVLVAEATLAGDVEAFGRYRARALRHGIEVESELWLELYTRSNGALVPDTLTLRRHYGEVDDDGNLADPALDDLEVDRALRAREVRGSQLDPSTRTNREGRAQ